MLKPWLFVGFMCNAPLVEKQDLGTICVKETSGAAERVAGGEIWSKSWKPQYVALPCRRPTFAGENYIEAPDKNHRLPRHRACSSFPLHLFLLGNDVLS